VRDKMQLIKIAAAQAKKTFRVVGNVDVIDLSPYKLELNGYVIVVEFDESKDRGFVAVQSPRKS
jgi:hypothetical protein